MTRGRLPETDEEACEDFRKGFPAEEAEQYIRIYLRLRANYSPADAALKTMTEALSGQRMGLLGRN